MNAGAEVLRDLVRKNWPYGDGPVYASNKKTPASSGWIHVARPVELESRANAHGGFQSCSSRRLDVARRHESHAGDVAESNQTTCRPQFQRRRARRSARGHSGRVAGDTPLPRRGATGRHRARRSSPLPRTRCSRARTSGCSHAAGTRRRGVSSGGRAGNASRTRRRPQRDRKTDDVVGVDEIVRRHIEVELCEHAAGEADLEPVARLSSHRRGGDRTHR